MNNKQKTALGAGAALVATGIIVAKARAKEPEEPEEPEGTGIEIEIRDSNGNIVPHNSPASLNEGEIYSVKITVTNATTRGGIPWEAELTTNVYADVSDGFSTVHLVPSNDNVSVFAGSQAIAYSYTISPEIGVGGMTGGIFVSVHDPLGGVLKQINEQLTIVAEPTIYGAGIVITA